MGFYDLQPTHNLDTSLNLPITDYLQQIRINFQDVITDVGGEVTTLLALYIKKDGSVAFTGDQSMGGNQLTNVGAPGAGGDAANKTYVDTEISTAGGAFIKKDGSVAFTGDQSMGGNQLTNVGTPGAGTDAANKDYVDGLGFRHQYDGWYADNVGAGSGPTQMSRFANGADVDKVFLPRAGSVTGVWVHSDEARTAGTLTVEVYVNGVGTGLTAVLDGTNTTFDATTQALNLDTFVAGDQLDVRFTTDAGWTPISADIRAGLEVTT